MSSHLFGQSPGNYRYQQIRAVYIKLSLRANGWHSYFAEQHNASIKILIKIIGTNNVNVSRTKQYETKVSESLKGTSIPIYAVITTKTLFRKGAAQMSDDIIFLEEVQK